ncbi:cell division protein kinase [Hamiltosporidium magnivora]|uniref:Cell division protein kinase n=1 Tax=Hamiltosporidium magnivora TaxID=148818 RepID=A0A4Q9LQX3_9MICR|nr:cell division protein kinase [Hamiltosporidium magnivora]
MDNFREVKQIGEGTYGKVFKGFYKDNKLPMAIKIISIEQDSGIHFTAYREIKILKSVNSNHIVKLKDVFIEEFYLFIVMEFLEFDLSGLLHAGYRFSDEQILSLSYQLLSGTKALHDLNLIHRDIKASNILMNKDGLLKLVDFGLTRSNDIIMTNRICTLWYRAPELLLGVTSYDNKIDSWSVACVIVEMKTGITLFKGYEEVSQLKLIFDMFGVPKEKFPWLEMFDTKKFKKNKPWYEIIDTAFSKMFNSDMLELLEEMFKMSPRERISVKNSLKLRVFHDFDSSIRIPINFKEIHDYDCKERKKA